MKRLSVLLLILFLTGCSQGVTVKNPFSKGLMAPVPKAFPVDQIRQVVDQICVPPTVPDIRGDMAAGWWDGYNRNRKTTAYTPQELADIQALKDLCKKNPADRTDYEIGFIGGALLDDALLKFNAVQFLGPDAISIMTLLGVMP